MATRGTKRGSKLDKPVLPQTLVRGVRTVGTTEGKDSGEQVRDTRQSFFNRSIRDLRQAPTDAAAIRLLARIHGDVSAAVSAMVRLANTPVTFTAYDVNHQVSPAGDLLVRSILTRFDYLSDYTNGFDARQALSGLTETLLREVPMTGACALELVLDDLRLPYELVAVPVSSLKWKAGKQKRGRARKPIPYQTAQGDDVDLDIPTFFYAALDQDPSTTYAVSQLEPALTTAIFHSEVVEDVRRSIRYAGHSRLVIKLLTDEIVKSAPADVRADKEKMREWLESIREGVKDEVRKLKPEDALVYFNTVEAELLNSEIKNKADYSPMMETIDGLQSTALKTPPSILGKRMGGSQNISSTESLLFLKTAAGIQPPVAAALSRALTLAVRLFGFPGYVRVSFEGINLRPDIEVEAFKIMRQRRLLELLSLGFISDDEAADRLGTGPRAPGAPPLSGTGFYPGANVETPSPNGDPARRALVPDAPDKAGGDSQ